MSEIEPLIDELYQLPLGDFTAARNALAKTLKGADAARVKALGKPTVVPWAVNQLYWHRRSAYDRLLAAGRSLRDAQIAALGGKGGEIARAGATHRQALSAAVADAVALAAEHGVKPAADQLARMLEMLSLRPDSGEAPGRSTDLVQASGLEALAGITLADTAGRAETSASPSAKGGDRGQERHEGRGKRAPTGVEDADAERRSEAAAASRKQAEQNLLAAERVLDDARKVEEAAQRDVAEAERALERSQLALDAARRERRAAHEAWLAAKALRW